MGKSIGIQMVNLKGVKKLRAGTIIETVPSFNVEKKNTDSISCQKRYGMFKNYLIVGTLFMWVYLASYTIPQHVNKFLEKERTCFKNTLLKINVTNLFFFFFLPLQSYEIYKKIAYFVLFQIYNQGF